jgi:short-subunit dehydrogenase
MPFLLSPQAFAKRAARVIARQSSHAVIPWQMGLVAKLLRVLPNAWFDAIFAGRPRKLRESETPR